MTTNTDAYTVEPGQRIPVAPPVPAPVRPGAVDPATGRPRRTPPRKTAVKPAHVVIGGGAGVLALASAAAIGGPVAWVAAAAAAGVPVALVARAAGRRRRSGPGRSTTRRNSSTGARTTRASGGGGNPLGDVLGSIIPKGGKTTGRASRTGGTGKTGSATTGHRSGGTGGKLGLPKATTAAGRRTAAGPKVGASTKVGAGPKRTSAGPKNRAAGTGPKTSTGPKAGKPKVGTGGPSGTGPGGSRRRSRSAAGTGPGGTTAGGPRRSSRKQNAAGTGGGGGGKTKGGGKKVGTVGSAGLPIRGRMPRTHLGQRLKHNRQQGQDAAIDRMLALGPRQIKAARARRKAALKAKKRIGKGRSNYAGVTAAGFRAGGTAREAARAAWRARKAGRKTTAQRARGVVTGALGAATAFTARGALAGAKKAHGKWGKPAVGWARPRYAKAKRAAMRRGKNLGQRLWWTATSNKEQLDKLYAQLDADKAARQKARADRKAARKAKYAVPQTPSTQTAPTPVVPVQPPAPVVYTQPVQPAPIRTPATVGAGNTGGNAMARQFAPYNFAVDAAASLYKWTPGDGEGALFAFYHALPGCIEGADKIREGWFGLVQGTKQDLVGHLNRTHVKHMDDVINAYVQATKVVVRVKQAFERIHAHDLYRYETANAQVTNVQAGSGGDVNPYFDPEGPMTEYGHALRRWRPGRRSGSLFVWGNAMPGMRASSWLIANGINAMSQNVTEDLAGGLEETMAAALNDLYRWYASAAVSVGELEKSWYITHRPDIERAARKGARTANVPVRR